VCPDNRGYMYICDTSKRRKLLPAADLQEWDTTGVRHWDNVSCILGSGGVQISPIETEKWNASID